MEVSDSLFSSGIIVSDSVVPGNISNCLDNWKMLTSNIFCLDIVKGVKIPFEDLPTQDRVPAPYRLSQEEARGLDFELEQFRIKNIIELVIFEPGQIISNLFVREKPNGRYRVILDLKRLNRNVVYEHFKMTSLNSALEMVTPTSWMASVDLRDAFYTVPVRDSHKKYLRFYWNNQLWQFVSMPNGLACAPRFFTKLMTPVFATLRERGHHCFQYIDDSFICASSKEACELAVQEVCSVLANLGFAIHGEKSVFSPMQKLTFLGFEINASEMTVSLPLDKREKFQRAATEILEDAVTVRQVAGLVGMMTAYAAGVDYSKAHIKSLERDKNFWLKRHCGNFDGHARISEEGKADIFWWLNHLTYKKLIRMDSPSLEIITDASLEGWGAHVGMDSTGGRWNSEEKELHINQLELLAIKFGLQCYWEGSTHVSLRSDNMTAVAYIKNLGGVKSIGCDQIARDIWEWCENRNVVLSISHIPGVDNVLADFRSRSFSDSLEWELNSKIFDKICKVFGMPNMDLFATRLNNKCPCYASWEPDPQAVKLDAFTFPWNETLYYAFPPFSLVGRVIRKAERDGSNLILVAPRWPSQTWYSLLMQSTSRRLIFSKKKGNLLNPRLKDTHSSIESTALVVCRFSPRN